MKLIFSNEYFTFISKLILFRCFLKYLVKYWVEYSLSNHLIVLFLIKIFLAWLYILNYRRDMIWFFVHKINKILLFFILLNLFKLEILNLINKQWCLFCKLLLSILLLNMISFDSFLPAVNSFDLKSALVLGFFFIVS